MQGIKKNVTYTDDLLDLEELEYQNRHQNSPYSPYNQYGIQRNDENANRGVIYSGAIKQAALDMNDERSRTISSSFPPIPLNQNSRFSVPSYQQNKSQYQQIPQYAKLRAGEINPISCVDVLEHIKNCPVCSKFYNTDKTIYLVIIIILIIMLAILLKRLLEK